MQPAHSDLLPAKIRTCSVGLAKFYQPLNGLDPLSQPALPLSILLYRLWQGLILQPVWRVEL